jgi:hypothetical protein
VPRLATLLERDRQIPHATSDFTHIDGGKASTTPSRASGVRLYRLSGIMSTRRREAAAAAAKIGAPGRTRTCGPELRRLVLYPTELRARRRRKNLVYQRVTVILPARAGS